MPDGIVRPLRTDELPDVARIQHAARLASYPAFLPDDVVAGLDRAQAEASWRQLAQLAPQQRPEVLVAVDDDQICGFAAVGAAGDPDTGDQDAQLLDLAVDPEHRSAGHGSRLLSAAMEAAANGGAARVYTWLPAAGTQAHDFLISAGWAPDGAERTLDLRGDGAVLVEEVRLHTSVG